MHLDDPLWKRIDAFEIDDPDSEFSFSDRLARENGWSLLYAHRCITEYKKFMFLICTNDEPFTPSDQVDQVWHLHLLYTESYWTEFCQETLNRQIHHGPTKGGNQQKEQYTDWYARTKERYNDVFEMESPSDIWPESSVRFGELNFRRVNLHRYTVIPRLKYWLRKWIN